MEKYGAGSIVVSDYDHNWPTLFEQERTRIKKALGSFVLAIEHMGSTAVPGLPSKPIIDLLVGMPSLEEAKNDASSRLRHLATFMYRSTRHGSPASCSSLRGLQRDRAQAGIDHPIGWSGAQVLVRTPRPRLRKDELVTSGLLPCKWQLSLVLPQLAPELRFPHFYEYTGNVNWKAAPRGTLAVAHSCP